MYYEISLWKHTQNKGFYSSFFFLAILNNFFQGHNHICITTQYWLQSVINKAFVHLQYINKITKMQNKHLHRLAVIKNIVLRFHTRELRQLLCESRCYCSGWSDTSSLVFDLGNHTEQDFAKLQKLRSCISLKSTAANWHLCSRNLVGL